MNIQQAKFEVGEEAIYVGPNYLCQRVTILEVDFGDYEQISTGILDFDVFGYRTTIGNLYTVEHHLRKIPKKSTKSFEELMKSLKTSKGIPVIIP